MNLEDPDTTPHLMDEGLHANPSQLRSDMWSRIHQAADRIAAGDEAQRPTLTRIITDCLELVKPWERYFVFPGADLTESFLQRLAVNDSTVFPQLRRVERLLSELGDGASVLHDPLDLNLPLDELIEEARRKHYFTVLVADDLSPKQLEQLIAELREARGNDDDFIYELLQLSSIEDALAAVVINPQIQTVWVRGDIALRSQHPLRFFRRRADLLQRVEEHSRSGIELHGPLLAAAIHEMRPELDLYQTIEAAGTLTAASNRSHFRRSFFRGEHPAEIHMATVDGIRKRYRTPFFDALKRYSQRPIGNFHALPIARGNSVFNSDWISDMGEFYGDQIFMAETSSTVGGLDSLLSPHGSIRQAQQAASRAFGSKETYFATNGTSSSNKIVLQGLCRPGDIVLIDRNCHKSHHYGLVLTGALPVYLDAYPLPELAIYGGVPTESIVDRLREIEKNGELDRVRMVLLTNCTFDGVVYHPYQVMKQILAIKPDMIFLWDEAWFAFAQLHPTYRRRTAMAAAARLREELDSHEYRREFAAWRADPDDRLLPDPDKAVVRVYSTQSTHKSLSALRQGSMIHQWDEMFATDVEESFYEAYFTHTTTSPNYQIVASLDLARRQVELEGLAKVSNQLQMALEIRRIVAEDPDLSRYFRVLDPRDLIPAQWRESGVETYVPAQQGGLLAESIEAFRQDEFVLDPTRLTLYLANTGISGDAFRVGTLMNKYGIQVNKTGVNTALLMTNIGTTWSSVDYLLQALRDIVSQLDEDARTASMAEKRLFEHRVKRLTDDLPPLPDFSRFHQAFVHNRTGAGNMRAAFFLAYRAENHDYVEINDAKARLATGEELVSSRFITPYPPGFPVLVPGQVITPEIVEFLSDIAIAEIHGYRPELGLPVFTQAALERATGLASPQFHRVDPGPREGMPESGSPTVPGTGSQDPAPEPVPVPPIPAPPRHPNADQPGQAGPDPKTAPHGGPEEAPTRAPQPPPPPSGKAGKGKQPDEAGAAPGAAAAPTGKRQQAPESTPEAGPAAQTQGSPASASEEPEQEKPQRGAPPPPRGSSNTQPPAPAKLKPEAPPASPRP